MLVKEYAKSSFPGGTQTLDYALAVEAITTQKKENLILNVDGAIAVCFVDLLRGCGAFTREEADEAIKSGCLNGLFVVGRSIGFIGHYLDQVRRPHWVKPHPATHSLTRAIVAPHRPQSHPHTHPSHARRCA